MASDPERKSRFEREAKTISSLNHPHICTLYDVGREGDVDFLVMEHLEGETLADRLQTDRKRELDGDLHWHDLRHECGSRLAERGVPLHEIQYLMGHATNVTTQRYLNTTLDARARSIMVLDAKIG